MKKILSIIIGFLAINNGIVAGPNLYLVAGASTWNLDKFGFLGKSFIENNSQAIKGLAFVATLSGATLYHEKIIEKTQNFYQHSLKPIMESYQKWHQKTEGKTGMLLGAGAASWSVYNYFTNQGKSYQNLITALPMGILAGLWLKDATINTVAIMYEKNQWQKDQIKVTKEDKQKKICTKNIKALARLKELENKTNLLWKFWQEKHSDKNFQIDEIATLFKNQLKKENCDDSFEIPKQKTWLGWACHTEWNSWFSIPKIHFSSYNRLIDLQIEVLNRCVFKN